MIKHSCVKLKKLHHPEQFPKLKTNDLTHPLSLPLLYYLIVPLLCSVLKQNLKEKDYGELDICNSGLTSFPKYQNKAVFIRHY